MLRSKNLRVHFTMLMVVAAIVFLAGGSQALATTGSGSQNPDLTVTVSASPDVVTNGDLLTVTASVRNNTKRRQKVRVTARVTLPSGQTYAETITVSIAANRTESLTESYVIDPSIPRGNYSLTISANDGHGASSATASALID